jgi:hypothetical protein
MAAPGPRGPPSYTWKGRVLGRMRREALLFVPHPPPEIPCVKSPDLHSKPQQRKAYPTQGRSQDEFLKTNSMPARRFPPPWSVEELDACFVVRDHDGQQLAYVYFENEPGRRAKSGLLRRLANFECATRMATALTAMAPIFARSNADNFPERLDAVSDWRIPQHPRFPPVTFRHWPEVAGFAALDIAAHSGAATYPQSA